MIEHILVPMDGSPLAECVLPHVISVASAVNARVTLLHVMGRSKSNSSRAVDPLDWDIKKSEASRYLDHLAKRLCNAQLRAEAVLLEGVPAESIINYAVGHHADLIVMSSHGQSGLSEWNVSSIVQKVMLRSFISILLVRAFHFLEDKLTDARYRRLFVGLDCSARAEYILPLAVGLAQRYQADLILGTVVRRPDMFSRYALSQEDTDLLEKVTERSHQVAVSYLDNLRSRLSVQGVAVQTRLAISDNVTSALHDMVEQEKVDLVMLVAHGHTAEKRYPFGSVATSFIAYGNTPLMVVQDLYGGAARKKQAKLVVRGSKGRG